MSPPEKAPGFSRGEHVTTTLTLRLLPDEPRGHLTDGTVFWDVSDYRRTGPRTLVFDVEPSDFDALVERLGGRIRG